MRSWAAGGVVERSSEGVDSAVLGDRAMVLGASPRVARA